MEYADKDKYSGQEQDRTSVEKDPEVCVVASQPSTLVPNDLQFFNSDLKNDLAHDLDIIDAGHAEYIFQKAAEISDEDAEIIMREVLDEHHSGEQL